MKKRTAGLALAAVTGFSVLSATPAFADGPGQPPQPPEPPVMPYANCTEAANEGVYNIPSNHPRYGTHLDQDMDGYGCDDATKPVAQIPTTQSGWSTPQVDRVPSGGANTGIAQEPQGSNAGVLALGGGLVLAAAAGGTFIVRRRTAQQD
ncbi:excalibur calcium-binding domain-containing protein [Arthrobacter sp. Z1-15]